MGSVSQSLKATLTFAGSIDSSWKRSTKDVEKGLKDVDTQSKKLTRDQEKLVAEMKKGKLAGKDISDLSKQYGKLTDSIKRTEAEQARLNAQMEKSKRIEKFKTAGKGLFRRTGGLASGMLSPALTVGGVSVVSAALGSLIMPAARNAETAERAGIAKSYGVGLNTFDNWGAIGKQFGLNAENFGDLFEEYVKKEGDYKASGNEDKGPLVDAFKTLGFKGGDMAGLSDLAQFEKIVERALTLKDQSKASFALDSLFGGEASKVLMLIKQSGKSYKELMAEQQRYNLVTKEGADGAIAGNRAILNLQTVFSSALDEISGQLGTELSPTIKKLSGYLADWFKGGGIQKITGFIKNTLFPGLVAFGRGVVFVGKIIYAVAKKAAFLLPDKRSDQRDVLKMLAIWGVDKARETAQGNGQGEWFEQQLKLHPELPDKVKLNSRGWLGFNDDKSFRNPIGQYLTETENSLASFDDVLKQDDWKAFVRDPANQNGDTSRKLTDNRKFDYHFIINGAPGQDASAIGDAVMGITKTSPAFTGDNALFDSWSD